ncbi:metal-dependent hydrolase [Leptolyngbya cf. ectocarpi LEGE 11479]|uniref:Metal-dependent hydrolase n=1 Tax=Leptolyngbya cf. ectocarpi LEGE 11479 TaxID=1828722 RepID=A0A929F978_LEPEC|nr:metal-dependent hydrolase [Leptolyngbya ectocarpi]MBE9069710.1 metal-dependent hydrolase [Leptolyngbya cf. ectocarpi LEGE 11479]
MMAITHAAIATAGASLLLGTAQPLPLALAVLGSQFPDIDTTTSIIGQVCYPISSWIEDRYPHRSVTHSLAATVAIATISVTIGAALGDIKPWLALPLRHLLSCFSDCFTRQGVQLFWPDPAWSISVSNPKRRLRTGGPGEYWVLAVAVALLILGIWLAGTGGVTGQVNQSLGLRDGAMATYNANAASAEVYAEITGVWADDRTRADGRYLILDAVGREFVVTDGRGVYQTGKQLLVEKLTTATGAAMTRTTQTLTLNDEDVVTRLQALRMANPSARVYLSGSITVDFPEDVRPTVLPRQLLAVTVVGESVELAYCDLEVAIALLDDQWATGVLTLLSLAEAL